MEPILERILTDFVALPDEGVLTINGYFYFLHAYYERWEFCWDFCAQVYIYIIRHDVLTDGFSLTISNVVYIYIDFNLLGCVI